MPNDPVQVAVKHIRDSTSEYCVILSRASDADSYAVVNHQHLLNPNSKQARAAVLEMLIRWTALAHCL